MNRPLPLRSWSPRLRWLAVSTLVYGSLALFNAQALAQVPGASQWPKTDFDKRSVDLDEIMSGGPPKDGIPAIDTPRFASFAVADDWLNDDEPVVAVALNGDARAYPLQILIWHEIVNDTVGGTPVSVTFCPLCNSTVAFDRRVDGRVLDFGTTGRLRKSDMVMYDRQTESWWQQLVGRGIVGEMTGKTLTSVPADIVAYQSFKDAFPGGKVLSRATGHQRPYGRNPYSGYDSIQDRPFLFFDAVDPRLPAMERVISVQVGTRQRIYPFKAFEAGPVINDEFEGQALVLFSGQGTRSALDTREIADARMVRTVTAYRRELDEHVLRFSAQGDRFIDDRTRSTWDQFGRAIAGPLQGRRLTPATSGVHFAFAWLAFNPDSSIYAP